MNFRKPSICGNKLDTINNDTTDTAPVKNTIHMERFRKFVTLIPRRNKKTRILSEKKRAADDTNASSEKGWRNIVSRRRHSCSEIDSRRANFATGKRGTRHSVSFTNLEIREYNVIIGDNPSCRTGLPLDLGWEHNETVIEAIDDYENRRAPRRSSLGELCLGWTKRKEILAEVGGYTEEQIIQLEKERTLEILFGARGGRV